MTAESKHTPGPWTVRTDKPINSTDYIIVSKKWPIAAVMAVNDPVGLANARLIAAAPDHTLFAALVCADIVR